MLATQNELDRLATRIQQAYRRRDMHWNGGCSTTRVWTAAAMVLWQTHIENAEVPLDPELFVASQPMKSDVANPWIDVARAEAGVVYRRRVGHIIRQLQAELKREIKHAERLMEKGQPLPKVLSDPNPRISPLGRFILAQKAFRRDLAESFERDALAQHRSCPLYRSASLAFLAADQYPVDQAKHRFQGDPGPVHRTTTASLN